jgi:hypothetical protein
LSTDAESVCVAVAQVLFGLAAPTGRSDHPENQRGLERHDARTTDGLGARTSQRALALNTATWHNRLTDAPVKRSLIAYDH